MQIDWFTFGAQVVNFLLLVWLLKRFLYGPIVHAMAEREQRIADRFEEAHQKREAAEDAAETYRRKEAALERARADRLAAAEEEARERRQAMIGEARAEVDQLEAQWIETLRRERATFLQALSRRVGHEAVDLARRALADLADEALERQVVRVFAGRLRTLDDAPREALAAAVEAADGAVTIHTAFDLPDADRERLREALQAVRDGEVSLTFRRTEALTFGVELRAGGHKVAWSLDDYLGEMERRVRAQIDAALPSVLSNEDASAVGASPPAASTAASTNS
jgi:F-type H+-transporting ATPase subunit b